MTADATNDAIVNHNYANNLRKRVVTCSHNQKKTLLMKTTSLSGGLQKAAPMINKLVNAFTGAGWRYLPGDPEAVQARFDIHEHRYTHPRLRKDHLDTELMGRYVITSTDFNAPGDRDIFSGSIEAAARYLSNELPGMTVAGITDALTAIVAVHESVHWILHVWRTPKGSFTGAKAVFDNSSLDFDEGAAQLITRHIIMHDVEMLNVFEQLSRRQSPQYSIYREIQNYPLEKIIAVLSDPVVLLTQSWGLLVTAVNRGKRKVAYKKYIGSAAGDESFERFRITLREHRPDLADGVCGIGEFRGRIMAKAFGM